MARPRKALATMQKNLTIEEITARKQQEEKIKLDRHGLKAPGYLTTEGRTEFTRVVQDAAKINILDNLDLSVLAIYANAYAQFVEITQQMQQTDEQVRYITEDSKVSPLLNAQDKIVKQIMSCSTKLGLATTDRLKLIVPKKEESSTNKYLKYLDG